MKAIIYKLITYGFGLGLFVLACVLNSCNVTRTVTTQSQYWQKGDTSVVIQTKTIESYDARRHEFPY